MKYYILQLITSTVNGLCLEVLVFFWICCESFSGWNCFGFGLRKITDADRHGKAL